MFAPAQVPVIFIDKFNISGIEIMIPVGYRKKWPLDWRDCGSEGTS
jgi:hypothetical protein